MYPKVHDPWLSLAESRQILAISLAIAIAYSACATISLEFISLPGKIASVWLPSGLTFALVAFLKIKAFPGIVWGSMFGLIPLFADWKFSFASYIFLNLTCTLANCVQPWVATQIIKKYIANNSLFSTVKSSLLFLVAAILSPMLSATLGITISCWIGTIPWPAYGVCWISWWLASALAHLIFTPPIILLQGYYFDRSNKNGKQEIKQKLKTRGIDLIFVFIVIITIARIDFFHGYPLAYILFVILIWSIFRLGGIVSSLLVAIISLMAIVATAQNRGSFSYKSPNESIILLQSFIGILSITSLILLATLRERIAAQTALEKMLKNLEIIVDRRTRKLRRTEAQLDGFFSSAPVGMGILDQNLQSVRINEFLANMIHRSAPPEAKASARAEDDNLNANLEENKCNEFLSIQGSFSGLIPNDFFEQIFLTGEPVLNQEITRQDENNSQSQQTWLASCFLIPDPDPLHLGLVLKDISDRKELELQLQRQARIDGLTQVFNRRHFNELLQVHWETCGQSRLPISLILCDADYFKLYNDTYGHLMGDRCLITLASVLQDSVQRMSRGTQQETHHCVARYGGEEFAILLPGLATELALDVAKAIRQGMEQARIPHTNSLVNDYVTLSMGLATMIPKADDRPEQLIDLADRALYQAKRGGRNRVCILRSSLEADAR